MTADHRLSAAVWVVALIAIFGALWLAGPVFEPVAFALFIIAVVSPLQHRLQLHLPRFLALALVILVTVGVLAAFVLLVAWSFARVGRWLIGDAGQFQFLYDQAAAWLEGHGIAVAGLWAEHFDARWLVLAVQQISRQVNTTMSFSLIVFVYVLLGLLEVGDVGARIRAMENQEAARILLDGSMTAAVKLRRFLLVRTMMSAMTGVLVGAFLLLAGLPLATEWGIIAFALNYIPFIGPLIATVFPTLFALLQFFSWEAVLIVFVCLNVIQFVSGNYVEPRVSGHALDLSPFVVLFSVLLWTFLWGLAGAFVGVPITIALLSFAAEHPSSRWLADLLGTPAAPRQAGT
jgi:predicted PurR-regulated permease PerM